MAIAGALAGCADEPTSPGAAAPAAEATPLLAVSDARAGALQAALRDARGRALQVIDQGEARDALGRALDGLSTRLNARDHRGVVGALREARGALARYRATLAEDSGLLPDLEAISLMLTEVEATAADTVATTNPRED